MRTLALPFLFILQSHGLILYGVDLAHTAGILQALFIFVVATFAMLLFAAGHAGLFPCALQTGGESAALLLVAFTAVLCPIFWLEPHSNRHSKLSQAPSSKTC